MSRPSRVAATTPALRVNLRRLKAEFDEAYAEIEDATDRDSESFRAAEMAYRIWIKAIDGAALALLDDVEALESDGRDADEGRRDTRSSRASGTAHLNPAEVDHLFADLADIMDARGALGAPDDLLDS